MCHIQIGVCLGNCEKFECKLGPQYEAEFIFDLCPRSPLGE